VSPKKKKKILYMSKLMNEKAFKKKVKDTIPVKINGLPNSSNKKENLTTKMEID